MVILKSEVLLALFVAIFMHLLSCHKIPKRFHISFKFFTIFKIFLNSNIVQKKHAIKNIKEFVINFFWKAEKKK